MSAGQKQTLAQVPMAPRHSAERQMAKSVLPNISWLKVILPKAILPKVILSKSQLARSQLARSQLA